MAELIQILENRSRHLVFTQKPQWRITERKMERPWPRDLDVYYGTAETKVYQSTYQNFFSPMLSDLRKKAEAPLIYQAYVNRISNTVNFARAFYIKRKYGKEIGEVIADLSAAFKPIQRQGHRVFDNHDADVIAQSSEILAEILDKLYEITRKIYSLEPGGYPQPSPIVSQLSKLKIRDEEEKQEPCGVAEEGYGDAHRGDGDSDGGGGPLVINSFYQSKCLHLLVLILVVLFVEFLMFCLVVR